MRISISERPYDLLIVVVLCLALIPFIVFVEDNPIRVILGMLFVLFLPGYAITSTLFPNNSNIDWIERIAFSFGLSIAVVPLFGLILNYTPLGIRIESIVPTILTFTLALCSVAYHRRMKLDIKDRLSFTISVPPDNWSQYSFIDKVLSIALVASIIISISVFAYVITAPKIGQKYTEFYILDYEGLANNYPTQLNASENGTVIIGVVNHEHVVVNYSVEIVLTTIQYVYNVSTGMNDTIEIANQTLDTLFVLLDNERKLEVPYSFSILNTGDYKLKFYLYKNPGRTLVNQPLHLFITVQ